MSARNTGPAVAVVGCGVWGMNHVRVWHDLGFLRLACDLDPARLEPVRTQYPGVETSVDVDGVLDRPDIDAVVIATPPSTHAALAFKALDAGKDALVEKPMALRAAEGERLVERARRWERVLMVGHVLEYHPAVRRLCDLAHAEALGRVRYIYSHRLNLDVSAPRRARSGTSHPMISPSCCGFWGSCPRHWPATAAPISTRALRT